MSTLKDTFKPATSKNSSSKGPKFYNQEKNRCLEAIASDSNSIVRSAIARCPHTPTKVLVSMLEIEQDKSVLRSILLNDRMPRKAVAKFVNNDDDRRVEWFADDVELVEHFTQ